MEIEELHQHYRQSTGVSTDTRSVAEGNLFFTLRGNSFNGNDFVIEALEKGAAYAIVDDPDNIAPGAVDDARIIRVENSLKTLQDLARFHRSTFSFPVIGLTGSNGKTTTKELLSAVLRKKYSVAATTGNLNNHIGVPLTLLSVNPNECDMLIVEMGANHQGEIAALCDIARPTHGLITNIGKAHLEGFQSVEGVMKGKGELYDFLSKKKAIVFVNAKDELLMQMASRRRSFGEIVFYLSESSTVNPQLVETSPFVVYRDHHDHRIIATQLTGRYNFINICAALCVAAYFDVAESDAYAAISAYVPSNNRSEVIHKNGNTIILDAYNANPSSMAAALENFMAIDAPRKMVILGDMMELGHSSSSEHLAIGELVSKGKFELILLAGNNMKDALYPNPGAFYFPDKFSLHNWLQDHPQKETYILVKGSRNLGLESVINFL